ncbi:MAG: MogA/MoaB family molybdenum cofactor biosynthesis protein [Candidatus Thermoplasmatota archaeon]|jgi:molybdenum cofactor biosynthesis protein B|nr:MogA/MoaB family molybdenum cofactor biosynthesis protein [Candidatus Thermoplasmatota archaeon]
MIHDEGEKLSLKFMIVTVSDTRTEETDISGKIMSEFISSSGREAHRSIIRNDPSMIEKLLSREHGHYDVFIFIGGTGLGKHDITSRTIRKLGEREISGFGEQFRRAGLEDNKYSILSDASMFLYNGKMVFSLPGSEDAQRTAFQIINSIVDHAYHEINR